MSARAMRLLARLTVSLALLVVLARVLDVQLVLGRLRTLSPAWVGVALLLSVGQALVLAWRWRVTAARLGPDLPFREALAEYYLGNFLNQVLPGGVVGDVSRAWRHARHESAPRAAVTAVVLERASAQVVMTATACASVALLPALPTRLRFVVLLVGCATVAAAVLFVLRTDGDGVAGRFAEDARRAVTAPDVVVFQTATALLAVSSYIAIYLIAAAAIGEMDVLPTLAPLVAPVLMTMLLPVSVAGWGVREVAAAGLWGAVGLTPEDGVAISVAYGVIVLVSTVPGAFVLIAPRVGGRGRTERPHPDERSATGDGGRRSGSGSGRV